ncbi:MAG TPA: PaaI family thioesterase [Acidimicrobiales bacterium]|nr:PaaI family thioesterase [Acidimicrobiales bacterium]
MNANRRAEVAAAMRNLGHEFVAHEMSDDDLERFLPHLVALREIVDTAPVRSRPMPSSFAEFKMSVPEEGRHVRHQLFADSIVSGSANPMGLGATLWREGETSFMEVSLGRAFEGAPGRSHGGVVAALIDETMGLVLAIHDLLAFTGRLDITYHAPTPLDTALIARATLERRNGRKLHLEASVSAHDVKVASATALFIAVDPTLFLDRPTSES